MRPVPRLSDALFPGARVFVPGHSGELNLLYDELAARPEAARGVTFAGVQFPGVGRGDYLGVHPEARQESFFQSASVRSGVHDGRAKLFGFDYSGVFRYLRDGPAFDAAFVQVSPPDRDGWCSAGVCNDFVAAPWAAAKRKVVHVNPHMPRTASSFRIRREEVDIWVEAERAHGLGHHPRVQPQAAVPQ